MEPRNCTGCVTMNPCTSTGPNPMNIDPRNRRISTPTCARWRHHLHAHPETAFEEAATSAYVADKLRSFGLEVHTGLAEHRRRRRCCSNGRSDRRRSACAPISTRCTSTRSPASPHASGNAGKMHACGHDGHTTMLLARRARDERATQLRRHAVLSSSSRPRRTRAAAASWSRRGCSTAFRCSAVYGMHNWPRAAGRHSSRLRAGPLMGAVRHLRDRRRPAAGAHAAMAAPGHAIRCCSPRTRSTRCRRSSRATCIRWTRAWSA